MIYMDKIEVKRSLKKKIKKILKNNRSVDIMNKHIILNKISELMKLNIHLSCGKATDSKADRRFTHNRSDNSMKR